ncbi:sigma-54 factor interaction domain-containing protein [Flavonifractor plautii]|nr:sigma-54 factor interaction domain-containing protein [Flavonifractor plautii]
MDEIGELPPQLQVKLLTVLQDRRFYRIGGTAPLPMNARVVAATNRDLKKRWPRAPSAGISITDSTSFPCTFRPCGSGRRISCPWPSTSCCA